MTSLLGAVANRAAVLIRNSAPVSYAPSKMPILFSGQGGGATTQMRAMGSVGVLFSIVHRTSNATAAVHWHLYRSSTSGKPEDRVEVTRHPALDVWRKPNPRMPRQELVESAQQHIDLTGEGWLVVSFNPLAKSLPLEMWPVRPDRIAPVPDPDKFISGYIYTGPRGEKVPLECREVIQLRMPNPLDPYRGMGPVQSLLADLDAVRYSAEWNRNFFMNSAQPGGIIEVDKSLSDDEFNQLRDRWNEQHRGVAAAHRVAILEHGKYNPTQFTMRDMQFAELRQVGRDTILEAFGMGRPMLGITEDVNRANADAAEVVFARYLTRPRLERWKGALNNDFLPLFGASTVGLEFDYDNPVPEDTEAENATRLSKAQSTSLLVAAGYDAAEVLEAMDLPEMAWTKPAVPAALPPKGGTPDETTPVDDPQPAK